MLQKNFRVGFKTVTFNQSSVSTCQKNSILVLIGVIFLWWTNPALADTSVPADTIVNPKPIHITLLQLNDVYQISPVDEGQRGGLARIATLKKNILAENPHTFMVLAGDTLSPSIHSRMFQGKQMIDLWNQIGLDVATLGNHEFDFGNEILLARLKESRFRWITANVTDQTTGKPFGDLPPYVIFNVEGVKIGFLGALTPETVNASHPGPNIRFKDPIYAACEAVNRMNREGVDVIVAVTHLPMNDDKRMAQSLNHRVTLIMGGHEHALLQSIASGTPIFKVGSDARTLGRVDLFLNPESHHLESMDWQMIPVDGKTPEDPAIAASVKVYEDQVNQALGEVVGKTSVMLDARQKTSRSQETNLGNFLTDAFRNRLKTDVALINGGSIRSNTTYGPGPLTRHDISNILPFGNPVVKAAISGAKLKAALENGFSRIQEEEPGRFPQVSGIKLIFDGRKPIGSRVTAILINGVPLNPNKIYTLATTPYLLNGGDGYDALKNASVLLSPEEWPLETDLVEAVIQDAKVIAPQTEGRIKRLDSPNAIPAKPGI